MPFHQYLTPELVRLVVSQFKLSHSGVHGPSHWMRVRKNGLELAQKTGAILVFLPLAKCMVCCKSSSIESGLWSC